MIKGASGGDELHQCVDSREQAGGSCDDPGQEGADAPAAQGYGQVGLGPELLQRVDRLGDQVHLAKICDKVSPEEVQGQGDVWEGGEQHPLVDNLELPETS